MSEALDGDDSPSMISGAIQRIQPIVWSSVVVMGVLVTSSRTLAIPKSLMHASFLLFCFLDTSQWNERYLMMEWTYVVGDENVALGFRVSFVMITFVE